MTMKMNEINFLIAQPHDCAEDDVYVRVDEHGAGPTPAVPIEVAVDGFDWDEGRVILVPDRPLVSWAYIERYVPDIRQQVEDAIHEQNWAAFQRIMGE